MILVVFALIAVVLAAPIVAAIVSGLTPAVVALLTHLNATANQKRFVGALVAMIVGFVESATQADGTAEFAIGALLFSLLAFVIQQLTYIKLWKSMNLNAKPLLFPKSGFGNPT